LARPDNLQHTLHAAARCTPRRIATRGFTLLECALAIVILGVGVLAVIEAQGAFFRANRFSSNAATAGYLAGEIRERMRGLPKHDPVTGLWLQGTTLRGWGPESGETLVEDFDDIDDFDSQEFGRGAAQAGPITARGTVIPQVNFDGIVETASGNPVPLRGWRQTVEVVKVEPTDYSVVRADSFERLSAAPRLSVDQFALRVTVTVTFQGPDDPAPVEMARLSWVVP
jgi:prepilin-type N-terminal cleavage/methylation domain-containing protein